VGKRSLPNSRFAILPNVSPSLTCSLREGETCPAGLGSGKNACFGGWLGQVR